MKPTVGEAGGVRLELDVDVSALAPSLAGDVEEVGPDHPPAPADLDDPSGGRRVRGRRLRARGGASSSTAIGVPWLMDIPFLGWAFKSTSDTDVTARLVIAAQARIERSPEEQVADSIRRRLAFERSQPAARAAPRDRRAPPGRCASRRVADEAEAQAIAARLRTSARPARVSRWESSSGPVFDVTLSPFRDPLRRQRQPRSQLREEGYDPELVVVPVEAR